jgi:hypothetical protein
LGWKELEFSIEYLGKMSVRIQLDSPRTFYTNADLISGRVILSLSKDETVNAIVVKLEGSSDSTVIAPRPGIPSQYGPNGNIVVQGRNEVLSEEHKILYKLTQVFPPLDNSQNATLGLSYTLPAGQHVYPFKFKIPFNNACGQIRDTGLGFGATHQQMRYPHIKQTLPPSLYGSDGVAAIYYYVKVTVQRPGIWRENRRSVVGFKFMPMDPPRPEPTGQESFARRQHAFDSGLSTWARKKSIFSKKSQTSAEDAPILPSVQVDARLPSPSILTCHEPVPLRIILKHKNQSPAQIFLTSIQIELIGHTTIRASTVQANKSNIWVIATAANLSIPVGKPNAPADTESTVDNSLWNQVPLPNTISPTFKTCNIQRNYELKVTVGLGYGTVGDIQPQKVHLPLMFPVQVFSGIAPPAALLDALSSQPGAAAVPTSPTGRPDGPPAMPPRPNTANGTPSSATPQTHDPLYPPQLGTPAAEAAMDAPPSYEDAMADDLAPIDGPRREYSGMSDEKGLHPPRY